MKRALLMLALFLPTVATAQIYPLREYATTQRTDNGQTIKFLRSEQSGLTYVGACKGTGADKLCDLAKDGTYTTTGNVTFRVKGWQLVSADNGRPCVYTNQALDCD